MKISELLLKFKKENNLDDPNFAIDTHWLIKSIEGLENYHPILGGEINKNEAKVLTDLLIRRFLHDEPVQYILGEWEFYGRTFLVGPGVLVPRAETELIIDEAKSLPQIEAAVDFGSGTGCLAITLALELDVQVMAIEKELEAFDYLKKNIQKWNLDKKISAIHSDAVSSNIETESIDLVVANPPYIASQDQRVEAHVKKWEPHSALYSENNGFADILSWAKEAHRILKPNGTYIFEFGAGQYPHIERELSGLFSALTPKRDLNEHDRVVVCKK